MARQTPKSYRWVPLLERFQFRRRERRQLGHSPLVLDVEQVVAEGPVAAAVGHAVVVAAAWPPVLLDGAFEDSHGRALEILLRIAEGAILPFQTCRNATTSELLGSKNTETLFNSAF